MIKFSIITPFYNDETYLPRCIASMQGQEYRNFEALLIDDGSADGSVRTCAACAAGDDRFRIVQVPHGGVSHARNAGLSLATGDYIIFLDADDWLEPAMLRAIAGELQEEDYDLVLFDSIQTNRDQKVYSSKRALPANQALPPDRFSALYADNFIVSNHVLAVLWDKAYQRTLIGEARFDETVDYGEDWLFAASLLKKVRKAVYIDQYFYHHRSTDHSRLSLKKRADLFESSILWEYHRKKELAGLYGLSFRQGTYEIFLNRVLACVVQEFGCTGRFSETYRRIRYYTEHTVTRDILAHAQEIRLRPRLRFSAFLMKRRQILLLTIMSACYALLQGHKSDMPAKSP